MVGILVYMYIRNELGFEVMGNKVVVGGLMIILDEKVWRGNGKNLDFLISRFWVYV